MTGLQRLIQDVMSQHPTVPENIRESYEYITMQVAFWLVGSATYSDVIRTIDFIRDEYSKPDQSVSTN